MVGLPPYPDERPEELKLTRATDKEWYHGDDPPSTPEERAPLLPVGPGVTKVIHARLLTAHAVVTIVPNTGELRIPYIRRTDKGDFSALLDALVGETGIHRIRFTNVFMDDDAAAEAYDQLDRYMDEFFPGMNDIDQSDTVRIQEAVHGFEHEVEQWGDDDVDTLVGEWTP